MEVPQTLPPDSPVSIFWCLNRSSSLHTYKHIYTLIEIWYTLPQSQNTAVCDFPQFFIKPETLPRVLFLCQLDLYTIHLFSTIIYYKVYLKLSNRKNISDHCVSMWYIFSITFLFFYVYGCVYIHEYLCTTGVPFAQEGQKMSSDPPKTGATMWVLGIKLGSSNWAISSVPTLTFSPLHY